MNQASITSTASFQSRLLRSERWRAGLLGCTFLVAIVVWIARRALGGVVASVDELFYSTIGLLAFGLLFNAGIVIDTRRRLERGLGFPKKRWALGCVIDLAIPLAALTLMELYSPRGGYAALSAPALLFLPMVIMLSILRLKPMISLWTGLGAAAGHWALTEFAIRNIEIDVHHWPLLFSYGVFIAMIGVAAAFISSQARRYVGEAVAEAVSAERAQRTLVAIEHDLSIARDIQSGLMPKGSPKIEGYDVAAMARPAQQTGGDYYDWQPLSDGRLVVVLADVTGHGIGPALVMAVCRAYARASAPGAANPALLMAQINGLIYQDLSTTGRFITMVIGVLGPDGSLELASAGHGPTLLYRAATGEVEWFGGDGLPLGIDDGSDYTPHLSLRLERGDVLVLLTDGFMEWARAGDEQQFGLERLRACVKANAQEPAKTIMERIDAAVQAFAAGSPQMDDTTGVVVKRV